MGNWYIHFCCCCFNNLSSKASEIILISIHSVATILVICYCFWKSICTLNLIIFLFILLFNLICLIFVINIRLWRAENLIKTKYKIVGTIFSTISLILSTICIILCFIGVVINNNNDCLKNPVTLKETLLTTITFIYLHIGLFLGITIWALLRTKIKFKIDGPIPLILNKYKYKGKNITVLPLEQINIRINLYNPGYYFSHSEKDVKNIQNNNPSDDDISEINHESQIPNDILNHSKEY